MAATDWMHNKLISGAGKDALTHMGMGAAGGAAVGAVNGEFSDTGDGLVRGALQGAMLGAGAGALSRAASARYGKGFAEALDKGPMQHGGFKTSYFTPNEKPSFFNVDQGLFGEGGSLRGYKHTPAPSGEAARRGASDLPEGGNIKSSWNPFKNAAKNAKETGENIKNGFSRDLFEKPGIDRQALRQRAGKGKSSRAEERLSKYINDPANVSAGRDKHDIGIDNVLKRHVSALEANEKPAFPKVYKPASNRPDINEAGRASFKAEQRAAALKPYQGNVNGNTYIKNISEMARDPAASKYSLNQLPIIG